MRRLPEKIEKNLQWAAIGLIAAAYGLLVLFSGQTWHIIATTFLLPLVLVIEVYLIRTGRATITSFYIPKLPKSVDWPIAIAGPTILVGKAILMWHNKEVITVWWAAGAIIESWIISHLCSYERADK